MTSFRNTLFLFIQITLRPLGSLNVSGNVSSRAFDSRKYIDFLHDKFMVRLGNVGLWFRELHTLIDPNAYGRNTSNVNSVTSRIIPISLYPKVTSISSQSSSGYLRRTEEILENFAHQILLLFSR